MSDEGTISKRGQALENQFFASVDEKLVAALKAELEKAETTKELAKLSGVGDEKVLDALAEAGVSPSTFPALRLFPLVAVAWADGVLSASEKETILLSAHQQGIEKSSSAGQVLSSWLSQEPPNSLFDAWEGFTKSLVKILSAEQADGLKTAIVSDVKQVAEASGGLLGWASISKGEHAIMNRVEKALTR
jgi:hypothetical protein